MKQLTCEMCGGTELIKQDGIFICQNCGTKYSVEEAKKMMIEGTVNVTGTVAVDNSKFADNYMSLAETAYAANNLQEAESYSNKIIEISPKFYNAWILKGKASGWQSTIVKVRIEETVQSFIKAIENSPDDKLDEVKKDVSSEISKLSTALIDLCCEHFVKFPSQDTANTILKFVDEVETYSLKLLIQCSVLPNEEKSLLATKINNAVSDAWNEKIYYDEAKFSTVTELNKFVEQVLACIELVKKAIDLSDTDNSQDIARYKNIIYIIEKSTYAHARRPRYDRPGTFEILGMFPTEIRVQLEMYKERCETKLRELDPSYTPTPKKKSGGCYIATAVYGSYDCSEVCTLRRYRDRVLLKTWYGSIFVKFYYSVSPILVKIFRGQVWFTKFCKNSLDQFVEKLSDEGFDGTPYID